jgi:hypothetical protein
MGKLTKEKGYCDQFILTSTLSVYWGVGKWAMKNGIPYSIIALFKIGEYISGYSL